MTHVGRPKEAFGIGLNHLGLDPFGCGAPDCEPSVFVVIVEKHHEALLVADEERRSAMARAFRCLRQYQARRTHLAERLVHLMLRKATHQPHCAVTDAVVALFRTRATRPGSKFRPMLSLRSKMSPLHTEKPTPVGNLTQGEPA